MLLLVTAYFMAFNGAAFGADRTVTFSTSDPGVTKSLEKWGLDLAWRDGNNVRRGAAFTGTDKVDVVRISFTGTAPVVNGDLQQSDIDLLNLRLDWVDAYASPNTVLYINEDTGDLDSWYLLNNGYANPLHWAQMIEATARRSQERGRTVECVLPFNEVDVYTDHRIAYMQTFHETIAELVKMPRFDNIRISSCTLNPDGAIGWYNYSKLWLGEATTHQLGGTFDNYATFFPLVRANGHQATNDELHNVMEAMVGIEYGMQTGIWWGTAELARGEFVKASDGKRLGYAEHRDNWTAASVYRAPSGQIQAFVGESERQARPTTYEFYCKDRPVFFDGYGPQQSYIVPTSGGDGYGTPNHRGAERVVNISWGDDVQPAVTTGRYILVNRHSHKVMEVEGGSTANGANIRQNTYTGGTHQQWDITPQDHLTGGDWSYFKVAAAHSGKSPDVYQFSFNNGGNIVQWDNGGGFGGLNQQWYFEYVEDGWFNIRNRWSNKCLDVAGSSTANGANIQQWDVNGGLNQQWRLLPVGAAIEFIAPSAPTGLNATVNSNSVNLTWNANSESDLAGYIVLRSTTGGGPYEIVGRGITGTSFTDIEVTSSVQYYYAVRAVDQSLNRSVNSNQVSCQGGTSNKAPYFVYGPLWRDSAVIGTMFSGSIAGDATDLDPDVLTFSKVSGPAWLSVAANGALSGTPLPANAGANSWIVRVSDGQGGTGDVTLNIAVDYPVTVSRDNMHSGTTIGLVPGDYTQLQLLSRGMANDAISSFHIEPGYKLVVYRDDNYLGDSMTSAYDITGLWFTDWDNQISSLRVQAIGSEPYFTCDPFTKKPADIGVAYSDTLWNAVDDPDLDPLSFTKISGPSWLTVSSTGVISGTPGAGDVGLNSFVVRVSDHDGSQDATMTIVVKAAPEAIARYAFEGNTNDSTSNNNDGTAFNGPVYVAGRFGQAIDLDGSNDYVKLPAGVVDSVDFTITCWVNWDGGGAWQRIFDFGNNTGEYMFLSPNGPGDKLRFGIRNNRNEHIVETLILPTGTWVHVAVTLTDQNAKLYVDGSWVATNAFTYVNPFDFKPINNYIGKSQFNDPLFNGRIDDFRVYNYVLSGDQIAEIMTANALSPSFLLDSFRNTDGLELTDYVGSSLASHISNPDGGALIFSKYSGPEWLTVAPDGTLSGIPKPADIGENYFTVYVENTIGQSDTATMAIQITNTYNGTKGLEDLLGLAAQWLTLDCGICEGADLDGDHDVTITDFSVLASNWLVGYGLQLHLKFDEMFGDVAEDSSNHNRPGQLVNAPVWSSGHDGGALTFNGSNYVEIADDAGLNPNNDNWSVAFWMKSSTASQGALIVSKRQTTAPYGQYLIGLSSGSSSTFTAGSKLTFLFREDASLQKGGYTTANISFGEWTHVCVLLDRVANTVYVYINGNSVPVTLDADGDLPTINNTFPLYIGRNPAIPSKPYYGLIDDVRIYNRALTAQEILEISQ